ncbi:MAG TPA: hypothetical protein VKK81_05450 [Candidatus Binatia bacterium]|nr:hypothetical protein [Candidatus Binatia bacterium]
MLTFCLLLLGVVLAGVVAGWHLWGRTPFIAAFFRGAGLGLGALGMGALVTGVLAYPAAFSFAGSFLAYFVVVVFVFVVLLLLG